MNRGSLHQATDSCLGVRDAVVFDIRVGRRCGREAGSTAGPQNRGRRPVPPGCRLTTLVAQYALRLRPRQFKTLANGVLGLAEEMD